MHILYHHRTRGQAVEGVHIRSVANALRGLGHTVDIMSFPGADPESATTPKTKAKNKKPLIKIITEHLPEFLFEFLEIAYNLITLYRVRGFLKKNKPDLIYERYSLFLFMTVFLAKRKGIPIILEINDSALVERVRPLILKRLAKRIEKWIFQNSSGLVFISSYFVNVAVNEYSHISPHIISPNAADPELFKPDIDKTASARRKLKLDEQVVCGFVGAFLPWHGIDQFVKTLIKRSDIPKNLTLLLVGDGPLYEETLASVKTANLENQIKFTGRVPHEQVSELIAAMDFSILPDSNHYGSPMKLFELMAMGVPLVCPSYAPITDIVQDQENGWLFTPKNEKEAIEKVFTLCSNKAELAQVSENASNFILEKRTWKHNAEQLLALHEKLGTK